MSTQLKLTIEDISLLKLALSEQLQETAKLPLTPNQEKQQQKRQKLMRKLTFIYADLCKLEDDSRVPDVRQDSCGSDQVKWLERGEI